MLLACGISFCCSAQNDMMNLKELRGCWISKDGHSLECWFQIAPDIWRGAGFTLSGADTTLSENLSLNASGESMVYSAQVLNQNEGKEVQFIACSFKKNSIVFCNDEHDFPNRISYRLRNEKRMKVIVSGKGKGFTIRFKKVGT